MPYPRKLCICEASLQTVTQVSPRSVVVQDLPHEVITSSWALPLWVLFRAPLCTWKTCLLDIQVIHCRKFYHKHESRVLTESITGRGANPYCMNCIVLAVNLQSWAVCLDHNFFQRKTATSTYTDLNCNCQFSTWGVFFFPFLIQWELCLYWAGLDHLYMSRLWKNIISVPNELNMSPS